MIHLSSFEAVRYRGIDGLSLPRLSRANLVTGVNGVGKTALMEAIWLFMGRYNQMLLWNPNVLRSEKGVLDPVERLSGDVLELQGVEDGAGHSLKTTFESISDVARPVAIGSAKGETVPQLPLAGRIHTYLDGKKIEEGGIGGMQPTPWGMVIHQNPAPPASLPSCIIESTKFQLDVTDEHLQRYSEVVRKNRKQELKKAVNLIFPKVEDVEILADRTGGSYLSAATTDGKLLPLHDLGGGAVRLCRLLLSFFASGDGIVLVDEVENGMHHSILREVWSHARRWMSEWNVQFVATTHSAECIEAAIGAFGDAAEDLSIHHLYVNGEAGRVEAATFNGETLEGARDLNLELRG